MKKMIVYLLIIITMKLFGQTIHMQFADSLFHERDYFRAVTEYKRQYYLSNDPQIKIIALEKIARSYLLSNRYELSLKYLNKLEHFVDEDNCSLLFLRGMNYLGMKAYPLAYQFFKQSKKCDSNGKSIVFQSILLSQNYRFQEAASLLDSSLRINSISLPVYREFARNLIGLNREEQKLRHKNPRIAGLLSFFIPGSGQIYAEHYYDGAMAFFYVSAFAFASYLAYQYDHSHGKKYIRTSISIGITSIFHLANIIGANRTAHYFNYKQKETLLRKINQVANRIPF